MQGILLLFEVRFGQAFGLTYMRSAILNSHAVGVTANVPFRQVQGPEHVEGLAIHVQVKFLG